jgi:hypothetical protein
MMVFGIGGAAFGDCKSLECITFLSSITEIGNYASCNCKNLREIVLNDGLQKIGRSAFEDCSSLVSISVPSIIAEIEMYAIKGCESLQEVMLHEEITKIVDCAFHDCPSVEVFSFPLFSRHLVAMVGKWADLNNKVDEVHGVVQWGNGKLFVPPVAIEGGRNWDSIKTILRRIERTVSYYEMKEATTIYELSLWKSKLDDAGNNTANSNDYRVAVPGPAQNTILEYLLGKRKTRSVNGVEELVPSFDV